jgi:hypothetical protein
VKLSCVNPFRTSQSQTKGLAGRAGYTGGDKALDQNAALLDIAEFVRYGASVIYL